MAEPHTETWSDAWVLTGPTAAGKTAIALELADRAPVEILSLDSMAVYRGLDLGTAKPTPAEQARAPHHLLDLVDPHEEFSLACYLEAAAQAVAGIRQRGRRPLFVGGTPLYLRALLRGVDPGPAADPQLRARWRARIATEGALVLWSHLAHIDPVAASRLHPSDTKRLIRAVEVFELTGRRISELQRHATPRAVDQRPLVWLLDWPRELLAQRIDQRVEAMFQGGLVDEVRRLRDAGGTLGLTARSAVGYGEVGEFLAGQIGLEEAMARVQRRTRQFAKRQRTWFRGLTECQPVAMATRSSPSQVAEELLRGLGRP